jgi:hypothetical protein
MHKRGCRSWTLHADVTHVLFFSSALGRYKCCTPNIVVTDSTL